MLCSNHNVWSVSTKSLQFYRACCYFIATMPLSRTRVLFMNIKECFHLFITFFIFNYRYNAVGRSKGLEDLGSMQLHLVICSFLAWAFVVLAVIKGVKTLGKVCGSILISFVHLALFYIFTRYMHLKRVSHSDKML